MDVVFASSAFRHGYTRQDFYEVLAGRYLKIRSQRGLDDVYELLGVTLAATTSMSFTGCFQASVCEFFTSVA